MRCHVVLTVVVMLLLAVVPLNADQAFVLDTTGKAVVAIDLQSGGIAKRLALEAEPYDLARSPDGARLVVLYRGAGEEQKYGPPWKPLNPGFAQAVDAKSLEKIGKAVPLGYDVGDVVFVKDGAIVLSPGYNSPGSDGLPAEMIRIDLQSGGVAKRVKLDRAAAQLGIDGGTLVLFAPRNARDRKSTAGAIRFYDPVTLEQSGEVIIDGEPDAPVAVAGSEYLYVLNGDKKGGGVLHAVSLRDRSVATIPVGNDATFGGVFGKRVYILGNGKGKGVLSVVEGKDLVKAIDVAGRPELFRVSADGSRAFVVGNTSLTEVNLADFTTGETKMFGAMAGQTPLDVGTGVGGRRAIAVFRDGEGWGRAVVIDLENDAKLTNFMTGSKGGRWGRSLSAGVLSAGSFVLARAAARAAGDSVFYYNIYAPRARGLARGPLTFSSSGSHAYALDNMTNDVTVIDMNSGERVTDLDVGKGARELIALGDRKTILAISDAQLTLIDSTTNKVAKQVPLKGAVTDVNVSDSAVIVASKGEVTVLDAQSGEVVSRVADVKSPSMVLR